MAENNIFDQFDSQSQGNVFDQFDAPATQPKVKREGFLISEYDDGSFGLGSVTRPIVHGIRDALPAAAEMTGRDDDEAVRRTIRAVGPAATALSPVAPGRNPTTTASWIWRDGSARGAQRIGTETGESIARQRAVSAVDDLAAHEALDVRPFGPSFNQGPVASVGKQLTETYGVGAPLRNALDETYQNMGQAAGRIADDISPTATAETAGAAAQRGLDRFRFSTLADLDPPDVRALGINPQAPMSPVTVMSRGAAETAEEAARIWPQIGGRNTTNTRGNPVPAARPMNETLTTRTTPEMLDDAQLTRVIRAPATQTSVATRAEALYERAWRMVPGLMRVNETANGNLIAPVNTRNALREVQSHIANDISGQRVINGELAARFANPHSNITLSDLRAVRTEVGRALSNRNPLQQTLDRGQLMSLYGAISRDMEVGLQTLANRAAIRTQSGGNRGDRVPVEVAQQAAGALRAFRTADRYYRQSMERMDRFSQVLQAQSPEQAANRLVKAAMSGNKGDIRQFRSAMAGLRAEERAEFGAMVVRDMGTPMPSARGMVQEHGFSAQSFVTNYQRMAPEARNLLFTPQHQQALDQMFRVANRIANVESLANTSRTGTNVLNMSAIAGAGTTLAGGDLLTPLAIGGAGLGASVIMSRPEYVRWATRYMQLRAAVRDGSDATIAPLYRHLTGLERMSDTNPELRAAHAAIVAELSGRRSERSAPAAPAAAQSSRTGQFSAPVGRPEGGYQPNAGELDAPIPEPTEPMRSLPDYGLGPMTPATRAGQPNAMARSYEPSGGENAALMARQHIGGTTGERVGSAANALLTYGPLPAQAYAHQVGQAGGAVQNALADPSISNVAAAGVHTGMAAMSPSLTLGSAALGYGNALMGDLGITTTSPAMAQQRKGGPSVPDLPGLSPDQQPAYKDAMGRLSAGQFRTGAERRALEGQVKMYQEMAAREAEGTRGLAEERKRAEQQEYDRRVQGAEVARDKELSRARRFSETEVGKFYDKTGGYAPAIAALGAGALYRAGTGPAKGFVGQEVAPYAVGTGAAFTAANAPFIYNAYMTEPDNPERRAFEAYSRELPEGHPRKAEAAAAAAGMPAENPVAAAALRELQPDRLLTRGGVAAIEGLGGPAGSYMMNMPRRYLRDSSSLRPDPRPVRTDVSEGRTDLVPSSSGPPRTTSSGPAETPALPSASPAGVGGGREQIPPTGTSGYLQGPRQSQIPVRPDEVRASSPPKYQDEHSKTAAGVIEGYLSRNQVPPVEQMRADIMQAFGEAGLKTPTPGVLTRKLKETHELVKAIENADPETQRRVLAVTLGTGRFLAVPAAAGGSAYLATEGKPLEVDVYPPRNALMLPY